VVSLFFVLGIHWIHSEYMGEVSTAVMLFEIADLQPVVHVVVLCLVVLEEWLNVAVDFLVKSLDLLRGRARVLFNLNWGTNNNRELGPSGDLENPAYPGEVGKRHVK